MGVSDYNEKCLRSTGSKVEGHTKKRNPDPDRYLFFSFVSFFSGSISRERRRMLLAAVWHQRRRTNDTLGKKEEKEARMFSSPRPYYFRMHARARGAAGEHFFPGAKLFLFRAKNLKNLSAVYVTKCNMLLSGTLKFGNISLGIRRWRQHKKGANFIGPPLLISRPAHISPLF